MTWEEISRRNHMEKYQHGYKGTSKKRAKGFKGKEKVEPLYTHKWTYTKTKRVHLIFWFRFKYSCCSRLVLVGSERMSNVGQMVKLVLVYGRIWSRSQWFVWTWVVGRQLRKQTVWRWIILIWILKAKIRRNYQAWNKYCTSSICRKHEVVGCTYITHFMVNLLIS